MPKLIESQQLVDLYNAVHQFTSLENDDSIDITDNTYNLFKEVHKIVNANKNIFYSIEYNKKTLPCIDEILFVDLSKTKEAINSERTYAWEIEYPGELLHRVLHHYGEPLPPLDTTKYDFVASINILYDFYWFLYRDRENNSYNNDLLVKFVPLFHKLIVDDIILQFSALSRTIEKYGLEIPETYVYVEKYK